MQQDSKLNRSKNHDQVDTDNVQSLGNFLQRERLKKQFTLEEVAEKTCIHIATLKAIESNDQDKMPAEVFARGFIKLYADFLSLDKQEILERYDRERGNMDESRAHPDNILSNEKLAESTSFFSLGKFIFLCILLGLVGLGYYFYISSQEPPATKSFSLKSETLLPTEEQNEEISLDEITTNPVPREDEIDSMPIIEEQNSFDETVVPAVPEVVPEDALPNFPPPADEINSPSIEETAPLFEQKNEPTSQNQAADSEVEEVEISTFNDEIDDAVDDTVDVAVEDNAVAAAPLSVSIDQDQPAAVEEEKINLRILFTERTWIQISIDNQPPKDFLFDPEEESSWQASDTLKLFLGNSGGARLFVDDKEIPITGVSGSPLRITIPDDLPKYGM